MICVTVRLDEDVLDDLVDAAGRSGMSRSDYIRHAIMWALYGAEPQGVVE
jgi:metal-responsive CopG/Arc/MetJ family transcriptional regulator